MYILGISAFYHDSAACLLKDGLIVAAAQEERFSRVKHDQAFPQQAIHYCLTQAGITTADLECVVFYEKPFLKFERLLETYLAFAPRGIASFLKAMPVWIKKKLWIKDLIRQQLDYQGTLLFPQHHQSHAASAFFPSPFEDAAFLTIDGVGEWSTTSFGVGNNNSITTLADIRFPHSLGLLYSAFTYYTGFKVNSGEYKVMGLAPYGEPRYKKQIYEHLIDLKEDGSFRLNMDYFNYCTGTTMTNRRFDTLFGGPPRKPESELTQREMDLARSVQEVCEEVVLKIGRHVQRTTNMRNLCLAGGVSLNCVANGKLLRSGIFDKIWIQPAAGDAGAALGSALYAWYQHYQNERQVVPETDAMQGSLLGPSYSREEVKSFLETNGYPHEIMSDEDLLPKVAKLIDQGKVIGWFQGRMEFGPRALGGRSILGDARSAEMQKKMNLKIKYRESFRPFAPAILQDNGSDYFGIEGASPYMLLVAPVADEKRKAVDGDQQQLTGLARLESVRSEIPAVTHVDYSARVQTVDPSRNARFYDLLTTFHERYGCPVVINTSFNVRGEPIVCSLEDGYRCFMRTEMDYLVLENALLAKDEQPPLVDDENWQQEFTLD